MDWRAVRPTQAIAVIPVAALTVVILSSWESPAMAGTATRAGAIVAVVLLAVTTLVHIPGGAARLSPVLATAALIELAPGLADGSTSMGWVVPLLAVSSLAGPIAVHSVLGSTRWMHRFAAAAVLAGGVLVVADVMLRRRAGELNCWPWCSANPYLVVDRPDLVRIARLAVAVTVTCWCISAGSAIAGRATRGRARPDVDRSLAQSTADAIPIALLATAVACMAVGLARRADMQIDSGETQVLTGLSLALLGAAALTAEQHSISIRLTRRRTRRLTRDLVALSRPGALVALLRDAVGDPTLSLRLDADVESAMNNASDRELVEVRRGFERVAVISSRADPARVRAALSPAVITVLENQHLLATADRELAALTASRRDVVQHGDQARRNLERDLHDGAQQRLLVLGLQLAAAKNGRGDAPVVDEAIGEAAAALTELRRIARGTVPPLLEESGLQEAIESIAEHAAIEIGVDSETAEGQRFPIDVERAAYRFVQSCVQCASDLGVTAVGIELADTTDGLVARCVLPGWCAVDLTDEVDRVGAAGGRIERRSDDGRGIYEVKFPRQAL